MAQPKKKLSSSRGNRRRSHLHIDTVALTLCSHCHEPVAPHRVCSSCGFYKGNRVVPQKS